MLHNDVTSLNVCYHEAEDKIFLIDFEMLAPRKESQSINRDIVNFFRSVIYDMMPLANAE
jgi:tRNA A-37 threonylcarbamoyl transferase component Bud32